jgi:DNA polymerase-3 subunit beta
MKFTCTQENLLRGVSQTAPIAGRNSQLPVLQYILAQADHNTLVLTTTDLEIGVRTVVGGKMTEEGSFMLPARRFLEYVQQLPKTNPITIEKKGVSVIVSTKGFRAQFSSADPDEFPLFPENVNDVGVTLPAELFCGAITQTIFASAREETRPEIRSVYVSLKDSALHVAATDSFRLAEYSARVSSLTDISVLLPLSSAQEIVRLFAHEGDIRITPHDNYVSFESGSVEVTSRLVDGVYPKYEDIIPTTHTTEFRIGRDEISRALKTLSVFLPRDSRRVSLSIRPQEGEMVATVAGGEAGQGEVRLEIEGEGDSVDVLMNIQYLMEGISHTPGETCEGYLSGPHSPVVFRRQGKEDAYVYVVMPIQV